MNENLYAQLKEDGGCFPIDVESALLKSFNIIEMIELNSHIVCVYNANPHYWTSKMDIAQRLIKTVRWNFNNSPIFGNANNFMQLLEQRHRENANNCEYSQYLEFAQSIAKEVMGSNISQDISMHICNKMLHQHLGTDKFFEIWGY